MASGQSSSKAEPGRGLVSAEGRPRVLAIAFACDPERGSESAGGWGTVNALAEFADVTVLHHPRHTDNIEAWRRRSPASQAHLRYVAVDTVPWGLWAQRIKPLARLSWRARYLGWLQEARKVALALHAEEPFDVAVHASLGIYWLPSTVVDLPMPSVWGPVSGAAPSPRSLWRCATLRVTESSNVYRRFPEELRRRTLIANRAVLSHIPDVPTVPRQPYLLFTSPLEQRKAPSLALRALARTPSDVRLLFIHRGPEEDRLKALARKLGVSERVEFRGRVPREEMWARIAETAGCVFTGLREEGGCALAEAMMVGAPVAVVDHGGAGLVAGASSDPGRVHAISPTTREETLERLAQAMTAMSRNPSSATGGYLDQEPTKRVLREAVETAMAARLKAS